MNDFEATIKSYKDGSVGLTYGPRSKPIVIVFDSEEDMKKVYKVMGGLLGESEDRSDRFKLPSKESGLKQQVYDFVALNEPVSTIQVVRSLNPRFRHGALNECCLRFLNEGLFKRASQQRLKVDRTPSKKELED
jgi:hypothetical protein